MLKNNNISVVSISSGQQYLRCDGLPDPRVVTQMNTYIHLWQKAACDDNELEIRCRDALPDKFLENNPQLAEIDQETEELMNSIEEIAQDNLTKQQMLDDMKSKEPKNTNKMENDMKEFLNRIREEMATQTKDITIAVIKKFSSSSQEKFQILVYENSLLKTQVEKLENKVKHLEENGKRKNFVVYGVKKEQTNSAVETIVSTLRKIMTVETNEINYAFRIGKEQRNVSVETFVMKFAEKRALGQARRAREERLAHQLAQLDRATT
ncbi:unnamed protein product [Pieris brassicae]|uniref:IC97/Casc1 N-terminal domain-containing protein n=1 Tax=Pieris brassicae TaxID=7116 RepID=A0A9P0TWL6_PIEBR|nr:unnamed protein product [Pieris brassicae]